MSDWRPIETAPRDGTRFLACKGRAILVGYMSSCVEWSGLDEQGNLAKRTVECFRMFPGKLTWNPTHWMPLPLPPVG